MSEERNVAELKVNLVLKCFVEFMINQAKH